MEKFIPEMQLFYIVDNRKVPGASYWKKEIIKKVLAENADHALLADYRHPLGGQVVLEWYAKDAGLEIETTRYIEAVLAKNWRHPK